MRWIISFFTAVCVHELGHYVFACIVGVGVNSAKVTPFGLKIVFDLSVASHAKEIPVYLGGSLFGLVSAYAVKLSGVFNEILPHYPMISIFLGLINLLPIKGLDGGNITESLLSVRFLPDKVSRYSQRLSIITVILFWALSLASETRIGVNISLILLSIYFIYGEL